MCWLLAVPALCTLQVCFPQGWHQKQSTLNKKVFFSCYLQKANTTGKEASILFYSTDHSACPSTMSSLANSPTCINGIAQRLLRFSNQQAPHPSCHVLPETQGVRGVTMPGGGRETFRCCTEGSVLVGNLDDRRTVGLDV